MRPAHRHARPTQASTLVLPAGPFVAQVIGQLTARDTIDRHTAAKSYAAADALNYADLSLPVACL